MVGADAAPAPKLRTQVTREALEIRPPVVLAIGRWELSCVA